MNRRFWMAVALQVIILLAMVSMHGYTLLTGEPVMLKTAPIDPWDPFRGEYVQLNYDISQLDAALPMEGYPYRSGQQVWVTLRRGEPYWAAVAVSDRKPATGPGEVALRGRIRWIDGPEEGQQAGRIFLSYGIEQFYVPEGQGRELQGQMVEMAVQAVVDKGGRAAIRSVFLEGEPIEWR
jgi:uncharacterized membrane-anchored protein